MGKLILDFIIFFYNWYFFLYLKINRIILLKSNIQYSANFDGLPDEVKEAFIKYVEHIKNNNIYGIEDFAINLDENNHHLKYETTFSKGSPIFSSSFYVYISKKKFFLANTYYGNPIVLHKKCIYVPYLNEVRSIGEVKKSNYIVFNLTKYLSYTIQHSIE